MIKSIIEGESSVRLKVNKGITLIALVITIIILIILAAIAISAVYGENGLITKTREAEKLTDIASVEEILQIELMALQIEKDKSAGIKQTDITALVDKLGVLKDYNVPSTPKNGYFTLSGITQKGNEIHDIKIWAKEMRIEIAKTSSWGDEEEEFEWRCFV